MSKALAIPSKSSTLSFLFILLEVINYRGKEWHVFRLTTIGHDNSNNRQPFPSSRINRREMIASGSQKKTRADQAMSGHVYVYLS